MHIIIRNLCDEYDAEKRSAPLTNSEMPRFRFYDRVRTSYAK